MFYLHFKRNYDLVLGLFQVVDEEVHLITAEWKPWPKGYLYNEECFLEVKLRGFYR
jgi:hypothetical protein